MPDKGVRLKLLYVWGHSYEFDNDDNWPLIEEFCQAMGGQDDVWYATNIEIFDCVQTWKQLRFAADSSFVLNPCAASAWVRVNGGAPVEIPGGAQAELR